MNKMISKDNFAKEYAKCKVLGELDRLTTRMEGDFLVELKKALEYCDVYVGLTARDKCLLGTMSFEVNRRVRGK